MGHPAFLAGPQGRCCLSDGDDLDSPLSPLLAPPPRPGRCLPSAQHIPLAENAREPDPWGPGAAFPTLNSLPSPWLGRGPGILFAHILLAPLSPLFKYKHFQGGILCVCSSIQTASSPHMCVVSALTTERSQGGWARTGPCSLPWAFPCSPGTEHMAAGCT